jgi:hypothetical protein
MSPPAGSCSSASAAGRPASAAQGGRRCASDDRAAQLVGWPSRSSAEPSWPAGTSDQGRVRHGRPRRISQTDRTSYDWEPRPREDPRPRRRLVWLPHLALALKRADGHEVEVHETRRDIFEGASGNIPARLHQGFHYPRSRLTRAACQITAEAFMARYGHLTRGVPVNIYAVAEHQSLVDFDQYVRRSPARSSS